MTRDESKLRAIVSSLAREPGNPILQKGLCAKLHDIIRPELLAFVLRRRKGPDSEDMIQDALIKLFRKAIRLAESGNVNASFTEEETRSYFITIAKNDLKDIAGNYYSQKAKENKAPDVPPPVIVASASQEAIRKAMYALPREARLIIRMRFVEYKSFSEIAKLLGINEAAVRQRCSRAIRKLRELLDA